MNSPVYDQYGSLVGWTREPPEDTIKIRDYFAARAMSLTIGSIYLAGDEEISKAAKRAYKMADAMLKEREKTNG